ncbi:Tat pathway signal sequence domain protein [Streptomyces sp. DHE17-7]|uniref:Tat pathway signal sequence domain protein n=1 Tax=Streptomyces sp. DHE17-7 TaxID=2759949 RepID=UPI0022EA397A|nr:Tat pathway signal sequence domain protein [Streptomyces sp. DHE17-7]MBJ6620562.1 Tat pathway signal sequence domain protein [Streptomyces sp. DHE17-7]
MRRTILSAVALACTAVLAGTAPAFADDPTPAPAAPATATPSAEPSPGRHRHPARSEPRPLRQRAGPGEHSPGRHDGTVPSVPEGAPDTGVADAPSSSGGAGLVGAGTGAGLLAGGAALFVVRRRRAATGA